jgi:hypothetical protein
MCIFRLSESQGFSKNETWYHPRGFPKMKHGILGEQLSPHIVLNIVGHVFSPYTVRLLNMAFLKSRPKGLNVLGVDLIILRVDKMFGMIYAMMDVVLRQGVNAIVALPHITYNKGVTKGVLLSILDRYQEAATTMGSAFHSTEQPLFLNNWSPI